MLADAGYPDGLDVDARLLHLRPAGPDRGGRRRPRQDRRPGDDQAGRDRPVQRQSWGAGRRTRCGSSRLAFNDPNTFLQLWFKTGTAFLSRYSNPAMDALIDQQAASTTRRSAWPTLHEIGRDEPRRAARDLPVEQPEPVRRRDRSRAGSRTAGLHAGRERRVAADRARGWARPGGWRPAGIGLLGAAARLQRARPRRGAFLVYVLVFLSGDPARALVPVTAPAEVVEGFRRALRVRPAAAGPVRAVPGRAVVRATSGRRPGSGSRPWASSWSGCR